MGKRKINIKFQLVSVKIVTKSIDSSESRIRISVPAFLRFRLSILSCVHVIVVFQNNFQNHRWLLEQI
jgi:hypothetical protein